MHHSQGLEGEREWVGEEKVRGDGGWVNLDSNLK
jgi:hypothetical protein